MLAWGGDSSPALAASRPNRRQIGPSEGLICRRFTRPGNPRQLQGARPQPVRSSPSSGPVATHRAQRRQPRAPCGNVRSPEVGADGPLSPAQLRSVRVGASEPDGHSPSPGSPTPSGHLRPVPQEPRPHPCLVTSGATSASSGGGIRTGTGVGAECPVLGDRVDHGQGLGTNPVRDVRTKGYVDLDPRAIGTRAVRHGHYHIVGTTALERR